MSLEGIEKREVPKKQVFGGSGVEIGSTGLRRYSGNIYEEFLSALQMPQCLKVYKEMSTNDATIGAILFIYEMMIRKTPWSIVAASESSTDKKIANFVKECKDDMSHSWEDFIAEVLSCFRYGWAWHEECYKKRSGYSRDPDRNSKFSDGKIGWAKIPGRSQDTWNSWVFDEKNNPDRLIGMEQVSYVFPKAVIIPWEKSLLFRTTGERGNPEGFSLLRRAYRSWYFKKFIEEIEGIGIERDLAGLPVLTTPLGIDIWNPNKPEAVALKAALEKMVSNVRRDKNEGIILPFDYKFELIGRSGTGRSFDTSKVINRWDQRIAITMLADILMLGTEKTGSFALANIKKSLLAAALEAQTANIANVINKYAIPRLVRLNAFHGYSDFPKIVPGEIEAPDMVQLAEAMSRLTDIGFNFLDDKVARYIFSALGVPTPDGKLFEKPEDKAKTQDKTDALRRFKEHQTDDKGEFNNTYESAGMKKFLHRLFMESKDGS